MGNSNEGSQWLEGYQKWVEVVIIYWRSSTEREGNMAQVFAIIRVEKTNRPSEVKLRQ